MSGEIRQIATGKHPLDRAQEMQEAITDVIHEIGEGMPVATVIGVLEITKQQVLMDALEDD